MTVFRYCLILNLAFKACNGLAWSIWGPQIKEPFEFEKWSEFVNISRKSSQWLLLNPTSFTGKLATKVTLSLAPLAITEVDLDKNVK